MEELDFDKLRRVQKAAHDADDAQRQTENRRDDARIAFMFTFNPVLVGRLLDLAQRPPASAQSEKWRTKAQNALDTMKRRGSKDDYWYPTVAAFELANDLLAAADAYDEQRGRIAALVEGLTLAEMALDFESPSNLTRRERKALAVIRDAIARATANTGEGK